jgi:hypothetical protein
MSDRLKRKGLMVELQERLDAVEIDLKGIAGSLQDALFAVGSRLDTNADEVARHAQRYVEVHRQGVELRKRLTDLQNE